jgi:hypothetical protein
MRFIGKRIGIFYLCVLWTTLLGCQKPALQAPALPENSSNLSSEAPPSEPITENEPVSEKIDLFKEISTGQALIVDPRTSSKNELRRERSPSSLVQQDECVEPLKSRNRFADRVTYFTYQHFEAMVAPLDYVRQAYDLPVSIAKFQAVSLQSHALCEVTAASLQKTLVGKNLPSTSTIAKINSFVKKINSLRERHQQGDATASWDLTKQWSRFFMCLSVVESLGNPDSQSSINSARNLAPKDYVRPMGVAFYEDPLQPPVSRLNIGLFQFTPNSKGNVLACLKQWNQLYPQCPVKENATESAMVRLLGSGYQTFNAFCGVNKIQQMFSVQVNTKDVTRSDPSNQIRPGELKDSAKRCVSLHFAAGKSYNHFGPLQNSTGTNLDKLMSCVGN